MAQHILILDDDLHESLRGRSFSPDSEHPLTVEAVFSALNQSGDDVSVRHATTVQEALDTLQGWYDAGIQPDLIICDYKLGQEGWGTDALAAIQAQAQQQPEHLQPVRRFLSSRSGFNRDSDILPSLEAEYCHAYELLYAAAHAIENETLQTTYASVASTSTLREHLNEMLGSALGLGTFENTDISPDELGNMDALQVAAELEAGELPPPDAFLRLNEASVRRALDATVDTASADATPYTVGEGLQGPSVTGVVARNAEEAAGYKATGASVIAVIEDDYDTHRHNALLHQADGLIMLDRGTSHIRILAEGLGIPVIFARDTELGAQLPASGEAVTIDGQALDVYLQEMPLQQPPQESREAMARLREQAIGASGMTWHDPEPAVPDHHGVAGHANIDRAAQVETARAMGAQGIGLVRTEHFFLEENRLADLQRYLLSAEPGDDPDAALLEPLRTAFQADMNALYAEALGKEPKLSMKPRLADFLPSETLPDPENRKAIQACAERTGLAEDVVQERVQAFYDRDLRGAAFLKEYSDFTRMQMEAICRAAMPHQTGKEEWEKEETVQVMVPMVRDAQDLRLFRRLLFGPIKETIDYKGALKIGAMLETKETFVTQDDHTHAENIRTLAQVADFVSIGTNDATAELLGIAREDPESIAAWQAESNIQLNPSVQIVPPVENALRATVRLLQEERRTMEEEAREYGDEPPEPLEISLCGRHAGTRHAAELAQELDMQAVSVAASERELTAGVIEAGRASLLAATAARRIIEADYAERMAEAQLGEEAAVAVEPSPEDEKQVFIIANDETSIVDYAPHMLSLKLPQHEWRACESVEQALEAAESVHNEGKIPYLLLDMVFPQGQMQGKDVIDAVLDTDNYPFLSRSNMAIMSNGQRGHREIQRVQLRNAFDDPESFINSLLPPEIDNQPDTRPVMILANDSEMMRRSIILAQRKVPGFEWRAAETPEEALDIAKAVAEEGREPFLLLDQLFDTSDKGGDDVVKEVERDEHPYLPKENIAFLSGNPYASGDLPCYESAEFIGDQASIIKSWMRTIGKQMPGSPTQPHILVVEDNPDEIEQVEDFLQEVYDARVDTAESGEKAQEKLYDVHAKGGRYDLVLCDIGLPGKDGRAVAADMEANGYIQPDQVILITSKPEVTHAASYTDSTSGRMTFHKPDMVAGALNDEITARLPPEKRPQPRPGFSERLAGEERGRSASFCEAKSQQSLPLSP